MINSGLMSVELLFNGNKIFEIPEFQREFVWGENEVSQMLSDFEDDRNSELNEVVKDSSGYLLGNIVLINESDSDRIL